MRLNMEERIKTAKLTRSEGLVAEYIINNLNSVCFMTATDIARKVRVSDATVIRLCRALGFSGFFHLQKDIQQQVMQQMEDGADALASPIEKLRVYMPGLRETNFISSHLECAINNIKSAIKKNDPDKFEAIASIIIQSRHKFVSGFRGCRGLADWTALILGHMLPNVRRNTSVGAENLETLIDLTPEDCVLLISFPRYAQAAIDTAAFAKQNGAKLLVLTDKLTAPVAADADQVVTVNVRGLTFFNSIVGQAFAIELMVGAVSKAIGSSNHDRLAAIDTYISKYGFF